MAAIAIAVATATAAAPAAHAQLPGSGYTADRFYNCGSFWYNQNCWYDGVLGYNSSFNRTWGWGSADYDGSGTVYVTVSGGTSSIAYFGASGANLARACYNPPSCNDQDSISMGITVGHPFDSTQHTIYGHAEA